MDKDQHPDLLVANGDNGDYASPPKPYHGVRIYLNRGHNQFEQAFFFPMPGLTKCVARDFDQDGDLDLACMAYYADLRNSPQQSFVYLENQGQLNFAASTFPQSSAGRWLTMDIGDLDGDGDDDLVLGAVKKGPGRDAYVPKALAGQWKQSPVSVMFLENTSKDSADR